MSEKLLFPDAPLREEDFKKPKKRSRKERDNDLKSVKEAIRTNKIQDKAKEEKKRNSKSEDIMRSKENEEIKIEEDKFPDYDEEILDRIIKEHARDEMSLGIFDWVINEYNKLSDKKLDNNNSDSYKLIVYLITKQGLDYNKSKLKEHISYLESI